MNIQLDENVQAEEVPKKTKHPQNRFSSPIFNDKLMSDLGNVLKKKKSPLATVRKQLFSYYYLSIVAFTYSFNFSLNC